MNAQQLRNSILQEAIEGRLVPQDPNDEPASVLLERIREEKRRLVKEGKLKKKDLEEKPISEDEKPFEIPDSWEWVRIKDISASITDGDHLPPPQTSSGIPFLVISNVVTGTLDFSKTRFVPKSYYDKLSDERKAKVNDLLFTVTGSYGKAILVSTDRLFCFQRHIALIRPLLCYAEYLLHVLNSSYIKGECDNKATGMAQKTVGLDVLRSFVIPLPPLAEQKRIVAKIEELLPKVEEYGKAQDALDKLNKELPEKLKKSILQEAISGRLVPQDPNDEPASVLLGKIRQEKAQLVKEGKLKKKDLEEKPISEDEKPFDIPESWEWTRIGFLANLFTGNSISKEVKDRKYTNVKGRWYIATKDVDFDNTIDYENGVFIPETDEPQFKIAPTNSILMCIEGGSAGRKIGILDRDVCFGNKLCCFCSYIIYNRYLYNYLQSSLFKEVFNQNKKGIIGGVSINMISPFIVPLPPLAEQKRIVAKIEELFAEIDKLKV